MKSNTLPHLLAVMVMAALPAQAQKADSYLNDMREALVPYGTMTAPSCHAVEIDLTGPWGNEALPDGTDPASPEEFTWSVLQADVLRLYVNLADLDEDKVMNKPLFSIGYISKHQKGTRYVPDNPAVMLVTHGLNATMMVHTVDLKKMDHLHGTAHATENQMGVSMDQRKFAIILFSDQQHADAFARAIQKAIVLCKAQ